MPILNHELPLHRRLWDDYWSIGEFERVYQSCKLWLLKDPLPGYKNVGICAVL